ncbi:MAG: transposase family protein [Acidobacteria bacterium]|nr:transposase family protein [Acidobacteriota bacterium]
MELVPRYPGRRKRRLPATTLELIRVARVAFRYGAPRTQVWLKRVHNLHVNTRTIQRVFRDFGVPVLTKTAKRRPKQLALFEKDEPGDSVQVDAKMVKLQREEGVSVTAIDDCTRYRVLRLCRRQNQATSLHFLDELRRDLPFPIRRLQCDNGSEFPLAFKLTVEAAGIRHQYMKPRRPEQNGKSNGVTASTTRSYGVSTTSRHARMPTPPWPTGSDGTTTTGSRWHCTAAPRPKSSTPNESLNTRHPVSKHAQRTAKVAAGRRDQS